jgi:hypothetical protein
VKKTVADADVSAKEVSYGIKFSGKFRGSDKTPAARQSSRDLRVGGLARQARAGSH